MSGHGEIRIHQNWALSMGLLVFILISMRMNNRTIKQFRPILRSCDASTTTPIFYLFRNKPQQGTRRTKSLDSGNREEQSSYVLTTLKLTKPTKVSQGS